MKKFDVRAYSISDFSEWYSDKKLELSPDFQRRSVWSSSAKAFLADTILRGKPFPKIILMQEFKDGKNIRVVVDGQQRLRAIFDFINDGVKISRAHNRENAGKVFSNLSEDIRLEFMQYEIGCDVLYAAPYSDLLDIFARINRYSVKLNAQEMRNATFSGFFKSAAYAVGYEYVEHWLRSRVLTKTSVSRMSEAELASDLLGCFLVQMQSSKAIEITYKRFEDMEASIPRAVERLKFSLNFVSNIYSEEELKSSAWSVKHMYFSLVTVIGHIQDEIGGLPKTTLNNTALIQTEKLKSILNGIISDYSVFSPQSSRSNTPENLRSFITNSTGATTDTQARILRAKYILSVLEENFGS